MTVCTLWLHVLRSIFWTNSGFAMAVGLSERLVPKVNHSYKQSVISVTLAGLL